MRQCLWSRHHAHAARKSPNQQVNSSADAPDFMYYFRAQRLCGRIGLRVRAIESNAGSLKPRIP